ncbi:myosin-binding striated muscle assembly central domain-containing protein [Trichoderma breve]|uniref:Myosin-binding striated muscle assembly central domain-containing protein n=1 Tax=Trichoderma breve TaxID=2034170 RepID=A0A9W9ECX1_9HYPO|nr:myosin-binding striated muscle assembly central domain-containing protein [Trichoderma breve]KAJ4864401.1 myosin-binding striated muscle assembly central domain-containing protein [Trichoderma breve]
MATVAQTLQSSGPAASLEDQTLLIFARLMEGGQEDEETVRDLDALTKLLNDDANAQQKNKEHKSICKLIDSDCVDTILCYLDMRQPEIVRGHATLTTSAYLRAADEQGSKNLSAFFFDRVKRGTYDDYIVAFCVAAAIFPIVPDLSAELFLNEGFLVSLGPLMRRKWKSRKVETACLEMLNASCMNSACREAIQKYCVEWLEEVVDQDLDGEVQHLAAVILAKLRVVPSNPATKDPNQPRIETAVTSIEDLSGMFTKMILRDEDHGRQHSIEGLAYASLQPKIKESIINNPELLKKLVKTLKDAPPRSPMTYGALSIFLNLTRYRPSLTEEEKKMSQLKAYADAAGKLAPPDALDDDDHVSKRCKAVFDVGLTPVLVTHSKNGSPASITIIISIIHSFAMTKALRGPLAQQGALTIARILISTNPTLVFGGNRSSSAIAAIRPLASILPPDPAADRRDLLPTFEGLMALTNLASMEDEEIPRSIISIAWGQIEEQMLSSNDRVSQAAVELVCNLMQAPEGIALYADGNPQAKNRIHILLALADAEDAGTRSAAGGALASLTGYESVAKLVLQREGGIKVILGMCIDEDEGLRHRGVVTLYNMVAGDVEVCQLAREKVKEADGIEALKESLKLTRRPEVLQLTVETLKALLGQE